jgi:hypothetical protein
VPVGQSSNDQGFAGDTGGEDREGEEEADEGEGGRRRQATSSRGGGRRSEVEREAGFEKATASEEIFELKGWNKMDGSWRAL